MTTSETQPSDCCILTSLLRIFFSLLPTLHVFKKPLHLVSPTVTDPEGITELMRFYYLRTQDPLAHHIRRCICSADLNSTHHLLNQKVGQDRRIRAYSLDVQRQTI